MRTRLRPLAILGALVAAIAGTVVGLAGPAHAADPFTVSLTVTNFVEGGASCQEWQAKVSVSVENQTAAPIPVTSATWTYSGNDATTNAFVSNGATATDPGGLVPGANLAPGTNTFAVTLDGTNPTSPSCAANPTLSLALVTPAGTVSGVEPIGGAPAQPDPVTTTTSSPGGAGIDLPYAPAVAPLVFGLLAGGGLVVIDRRRRRRGQPVTEPTPKPLVPR